MTVETFRNERKSMTVETLTAEERAWLEADPDFQKWDVRRKVLRIIDAQAAELTRHEADLQATHREYDRSTAALVAQLDAAKLEVERLRTDLCDLEALRQAQLGAAELGMHEANLTCEYAIRARDAAEARVAELTRERDEAGRTVLQCMSEIARLESEIARLTAKAAEARVRELEDQIDCL